LRSVEVDGFFSRYTTEGSKAFIPLVLSLPNVSELLVDDGAVGIFRIQPVSLENEYAYGGTCLCETIFSGRESPVLEYFFFFCLTAPAGSTIFNTFFLPFFILRLLPPVVLLLSGFDDGSFFITGLQHSYLLLQFLLF